MRGNLNIEHNRALRTPHSAVMNANARGNCVAFVAVAVLLRGEHLCGSNLEIPSSIVSKFHSVSEPYDIAVSFSDVMITKCSNVLHAGYRMHLPSYGYLILAIK